MIGILSNAVILCLQWGHSERGLTKFKAGKALKEAVN